MNYIVIVYYEDSMQPEVYGYFESTKQADDWIDRVLVNCNIAEYWITAIQDIRN